MRRGRKNRSSQAARTSDVVLDERLRLREYQSPFEGMTREQVDQGFIRLGAEAGREYVRLLRELESLLHRFDPIPLLARLATYHLFSPGGEDREVIEGLPVAPFHLEFLQALVLMRDDDSGHEFIVRPEEVERVGELAKALSEAWAHRGYERFDPTVAPADRARLLPQTLIRAHTTAVRNWGFPQQMARIVTDLVAPLDDDLEREAGVRATGLVRMLAAAVSLVEERFNAMLRRMAPVYGATTISAAVDAYYRRRRLLRCVSRPCARLRRDGRNPGATRRRS